MVAAVTAVLVMSVLQLHILDVVLYNAGYSSAKAVVPVLAAVAALVDAIAPAADRLGNVARNMRAV